MRSIDSTGRTDVMVVLSERMITRFSARFIISV